MKIRSQKNKTSLIKHAFQNFGKQRHTPNPTAFAGTEAVYREAKQNLRGQKK